MTHGKTYLTSDEIRPLARRSDPVGALLVAHCWGTIGLSLALFSIFPNVFTFVCAVIVIGSRQLGLAILMHDAAHRALFASSRVNEFVGKWLCGMPILADLVSYRHYHLSHHKNTQVEGDPDLVLSKPFPTTRASLKRKFMRDLTGQTGVKLIAAQIMLSLRLAGDPDAIDEANRQAQAFKGAGVKQLAVANLVVFLVMWAIGAWWWWFAFWLLPMLTWFQLVIRIRNIAEHGATEFSDNPLQNVRTTYANPVMRVLIAPYWVNYHLEHHLVMHVPCWNLRKLHNLMIAKGYGKDMRLSSGYWEVLKQAGWNNLTRPV